MTEQPTSHEGRQPLAARSQERTRPRADAAAATADTVAAAAALSSPVPAPNGPVGGGVAQP
ncbi:hypothetical protein GTW66_15430, partial [Streptomyces sp. SID5473]|nr:hypothetical protein [Streptomyces sp. SID5473]